MTYFNSGIAVASALPTAAALMPSRPRLEMPPARRSGTVAAYTQGMRGFASQHEQLTRMEVVRRLARLKGFAVGDEFTPEPMGQLGQPTYLVPSDTLVGTAHAAALGVHGRQDLFGGVVPRAFIATKAITHPLVETYAQAPEGWRHDFHAAIASAVLRGHSAFNCADAMAAGRKLLAHGSVRVKLVHETGGRGQTVVSDMAELQACLELLDEHNVERYGLVLEQNLTPVETLSVGQVVVGDTTATYYGQQHLTRNNTGREVYAGSELHVVRGGFDALLTSELPDAVRVAVEQALVYDTAVTHLYPGFFASRTNYDIAQGQDAQGRWRSGVLEQSWRLGGATGAELAALEVLAVDPSCNRVHTRCVEAYGEDAQLPAGATLYFQGVDDQLGPMLKYAMVIDDGDAA